MRWSVSGRGKRGGLRVIYYWLTAMDVILLLFVYPKTIQEDLTREQLKALKKVIDEESP